MSKSSYKDSPLYGRLIGRMVPASTEKSSYKSGYPSSQMWLTPQNREGLLGKNQWLKNLGCVVDIKEIVFFKTPRRMKTPNGMAKEISRQTRRNCCRYLVRAHLFSLVITPAHCKTHWNKSRHRKNTRAQPMLPFVTYANRAILWSTQQSVSRFYGEERSRSVGIPLCVIIKFEFSKFL